MRPDQNFDEDQAVCCTASTKAKTPTCGQLRSALVQHYRHGCQCSAVHSIQLCVPVFSKMLEKCVQDIKRGTEWLRSKAWQLLATSSFLTHLFSSLRKVESFKLMADAESFFEKLFLLKGFRSEPHDRADIPYRPRKGTEVKGSENLRENKAYADYWTPLYNQGNWLNSCVANAAAALHAYEFRKVAALTKQEHPPAINPSRAFIWYNARAAEIISELSLDEGNASEVVRVNMHESKWKNAACYTRSAMKVLQQKGACDETLWNYPTKPLKQDQLDAANIQPSSTAIANATFYRIWQYERVDTKHSKEEREKLVALEKENHTAADEIKDAEGEKVIYKLRAAISEGHPVQFGIHYYHKELTDQFIQVENATGKRWSLSKLTSKHERPKEHKCGSHTSNTYES